MFVDDMIIIHLPWQFCEKMCPCFGARVNFSDPNLKCLEKRDLLPEKGDEVLANSRPAMAEATGLQKPMDFGPKDLTLGTNMVGESMGPQ